MSKRIVCLLLIFIALVSCTAKGKTYRVGVDPSWYPLNLAGKEANVFAFSNELLMAISHEERICFESIRMNWDNLNWGLKEKKYEAILSSMMPRVSLENTYVFSDPFLHTGPVLVMGAKGKVNSMKGKEVAVDSMDQEVILIEHFPGVIVHYYDSIPVGLDQILSQEIDGILINYVQAADFVRGLYHGKVKIVTPPLDESGLRLITLTGENDELMKAFNRGLEKLRENGKLEKLLKKWELN